MPSRKIKDFSIDHLQVLDEKGRVDPELEPDLSPEQLRELYGAMVLAREADARLLKLQRQGRLGTFPPCTGHEASAVGAAFAMGPRDWLVGAFRELGARLLRGEPLLNYLRYYGGLEEGNVLPAGVERVLPIAVIVGSQTLHAAGIAFAMKQKKEDSAVLCFLGDGATSEGDFHEALNFASVWQAPVVYVIQNNGWAISVPRHKQTRAATLAQKALAYDIPALQVDGNDALAVVRATSEALARARAGGGPTLIEAVTYRLMMHTTADDPTKYRDEVEAQGWWAKEPLIRLRAYLEGRGLWDEDRQQALLEQCKQQIDAAVAAYEAEAAVKPDAPFDHVFAATHPELEAQRRDFLARLEAEVSHG